MCMGVVQPCPPVRNDIVTLRHLLFVLAPLVFRSFDSIVSNILRLKPPLPVFTTLALLFSG